MKPSACLLVLLGVGNWRIPGAAAERIAAKRTSAVALGAGKQRSRGVRFWHPEGNGIYSHDNAVAAQWLLLLAFPCSALTSSAKFSASFAERAIYQGDHWILKNVYTKPPSWKSRAPTRGDSNPTALGVWFVAQRLLSVLIVKSQRNLAMTGLLEPTPRYLGRAGFERVFALLVTFWKKRLMPLGPGVDGR